MQNESKFEVDSQSQQQNEKTKISKPLHITKQIKAQIYLSQTRVLVIITIISVSVAICLNIMFNKFLDKSILFQKVLYGGDFAVDTSSYLSSQQAQNASVQYVHYPKRYLRNDIYTCDAVSENKNVKRTFTYQLPYEISQDIEKSIFKHLNISLASQPSFASVQLVFNNTQQILLSDQLCINEHCLSVYEYSNSKNISDFLNCQQKGFQVCNTSIYLKVQSQVSSNITIEIKVEQSEINGQSCEYIQNFRSKLKQYLLVKSNIFKQTLVDAPDLKITHQSDAFFIAFRSLCVIVSIVFCVALSVIYALCRKSYLHDLEVKQKKEKEKERTERMGESSEISKEKRK